MPIWTARNEEELSSINFPDEWYKGIREFSAEDPEPNGTMMITWIGGKSAQFADKLPDDQGPYLQHFVFLLTYKWAQ